MGVMQFLVSHRQRLPDDVVERVYMSGLDETPWPSRAHWDGGLLVIERTVSDSGNLHCPWQRKDGGQMMSTACLMERERPYLLEVELARGAVHQIRSQLAYWETIGFVVPGPVRTELAQAKQEFSQAAATQSEPASAADHALRAIDTANRAADLLGESYTAQALSARRREEARVGTLFGVNLGRAHDQPEHATRITETFNTVVVPCSWPLVEAIEGQWDWSVPDAQIPWAKSHNMKVCCGPLLRLDAHGVPGWLTLWDGDFDSLLSFMLDHVKAVVSRYRGEVQIWQAASRINTATSLALTDQQKLEILVRTVDLVRQLDPRTPIYVTLSHPWAEYMARGEFGASPFDFADAVVRADLGLTALGLEIYSEESQGATLHRNMLAYSRLLDRWSLLGLPLVVSLTMPSAAVVPNPDESPADASTTDDGVSEGPEPIGPWDFSEVTQREWIERYVPLMVAKNGVQLIVWNQLFDSDRDGHACCGLIDADGRVKPAMDALHQVRRQYIS